MGVFRLGIAILIFVCLTISPIYADSGKPYDPTRDAFEDYQNALLHSQKEQKNIFVSIGGNWCTYCLKFSKDLKKSECHQIIKDRFIYLNVNYSNENKNRAFFALFPKINGYPYFMIISPEGELLEHALVRKFELEDDFRKMLESHIN